jgi:hypothetical protein
MALAAPDDNIPPGQGPEWGKAAPIGLLIILLLGLSLFFLIKNMNKQFRKVPASFDPPAPEASEDGVGDESPDTPDGSDGSDGAPGGPADPTDPAVTKPVTMDGTAAEPADEAGAPAAGGRPGD